MKKKNLKQIGIAVYANACENIEEIYRKVEDHPDFIHVDLVDYTFFPDSEKIDFLKIIDIKNKWPDKTLVLHIMSKKPSEYFSSILKSIDYVLIHAEISEELENTIQKLLDNNVQVGISIQYQTPVETLYPFMETFKMIQVLGIPKPGYSGQIMDQAALKCLDHVNKLKTNFDFVTCFDGGVTIDNIGKIDADYIVSGSSVLRSDNPINTILEMRTIANRNQ